MLFPDNGEKGLVEPPGIAPGSETLIACAFIPIVRPKPNPPNIGRQGYEVKNGAGRPGGGYSVLSGCFCMRSSACRSV